MPDPNWSDLRIVLAVARGGTLAAASRLAKLNETTIARRLAAAEAALAARLFLRTRNGTLRPTEAGAHAIAAAERVEQALAALQAAVSHADATVAGTVRLTAVPILANRLLIPAAAALAARHPELHLEVVAEPRDLSLTDHEADIALRLARPRPAAGAALLARRLGIVAYAIYAPAGLSTEAAAALPWIGYAGTMTALPQARWLAALPGRPTPCLACNDAAAILQAIAAGRGRSLLPCAVADREPALQRQHCPDPPAPPQREAWLLTRPDLRRLARITATVAWLGQTLAAAGIVP